MSTVYKPDQTHYQLEHKLGEGLNSNVWRATRYDSTGKNTRATALKLPKDQNSVPFLRREYEILNRMNSVHVVRVIAWETFGGEPALALEWIDGVTLTELAQYKTLTSRQRDEIVRQIHVGLSDLAKSGACHGDLHPGNIMIDREGRAVLIDFASGKTPEGLLQATPAFVSPEIWRGASFSAESDRFALKVIREHMITGYRELPERSRSAKDFKVAKKDDEARNEIAKLVASLLATKSKSAGTQILETSEHDELSDIDMRSIASRFANPHRRVVRAACLLVVALTLHIPVFADDPPPEPQGSAQILVSSKKWMQIKLNGDDAGYAPVKLTRLKSGFQHIEWKSATSRGEYRFHMRAGDTVRLGENKQGELVRLENRAGSEGTTKAPRTKRKVH